jgi:hypothetical protein
MVATAAAAAAADSFAAWCITDNRSVDAYHRRPPPPLASPRLARLTCIGVKEGSELPLTTAMTGVASTYRQSPDGTYRHLPGTSRLRIRIFSLYFFNRRKHFALSASTTPTPSLHKPV